MGKYINSINGRPLPSFDKDISILKLVPGSKIITEPETWHEGIVCLAENLTFQVVAYAYDEIELLRFKRPDNRPKVWMYVPNANQYAI